MVIMGVQVGVALMMLSALVVVVVALVPRRLILPLVQLALVELV
jgi:hypothetical protein